MPKDIFTAEWFPYYFERFEGSARVAVMSLAEEGGYHKAIRIAWKFGSVPSDPALLAAMIQKKCTPKMAAKILEMFEPMPGVPSRAIHPTVEEIRAEQERKYLRYKKGGEITAEKRWGKTDVPSSATGAVGVSPTKDDGERDAHHSSQNSSAIAKLKPGDSYGVADRDRDRDSDSEQERDSESDSFSETDSCVRACVRDFSDVDPRLVEIAVLETLMRRKGSQNEHRPIRSTAYFREEIQTMVLNSKKLSEKMINHVLERRRQQSAGERSILDLTTVQGVADAAA